MRLNEAREQIGRKVIYKSAPFAPIEVGVITSVNETYVFVRYGSDQHSKATYPDMLTLEHKP